MKIIITEGGRKRTLPDHIDSSRVAGLDDADRIVVDDFDARNAEVRKVGGFPLTPSMFGLTLCCDAYDKGVDDGVVCRSCYSPEETGHYIFRADDGTFPGLDPVREIQEV